MKLGKPPVIEAWIEFHSLLNEEVPQWEVHNAKKFVDEYYPDLQHQMVATQHRLIYDMHGKEKGKVSTLFERFRGTAPDGDRVIQVGRQILVLNVLKNEGRIWPTFETWRDESLKLLSRYVEFIKREHIIGIRPAIHYRDLVTLPTADGKLAIEEYLRVYPKVPNEFGEIAHFGIELFLSGLSNAGLTRLSVVPMPDPERQGLADFQLDWHVEINPKQTLQPEQNEIKDWLDKAQADVGDAFERIFTPKAWALFEPEG